jgi:hypothetical protein
MAAKTDDLARVDLALRSVEAVLDELPRLAEDWPAITQDERLAWSLDWGNEMAKLRQLAEAESAGRLDALRARRYRALAERAVMALPLIGQLDLRPPAERVLADARSSRPSQMLAEGSAGS